jgi:hypothetical protein
MWSTCEKAHAQAADLDVHVLVPGELPDVA